MKTLSTLCKLEYFEENSDVHISASLEYVVKLKRKFISEWIENHFKMLKINLI